VHLVEVDYIDADPLEARLGLAENRLALEVVDHPAPGTLQQRALGEHVRRLAHPFQRAADDLLRVAEAVCGCGVDPVDPKFECVMDRGDRLLVLLGPPS
jgi:hypothetical protein